MNDGNFGLVNIHGNEAIFDICSDMGSPHWRQKEAFSSKNENA
jgi:hypothetical protein